ncbi:uncharacterized protein LOC144633534 [Oculina patagonica]
MASFLIVLGKLSFLIQIFGFQVTTSHFSSYKCNSTSYTLLHGLQYTNVSAVKWMCSGCSLNETKKPICQRHYYAPMASCIGPQSWRISFGLKVWPDGNIPDNETGLHSESVNDGFAEAFTMEPSKRALVTDMGDVVFVQNTALSLNWTSSSPELQFTVDYSMDGLQWNDYIEDGQIKVFKIHSYHPTACLCRKVLARFLRIKIAEESDFGLGLEGRLDTTNCPSIRSPSGYVENT